MSNLTIDQILAEKRQEDNPDIYGIEKEASSQASQPSQFSTEEVEKMASLLIEADLPSENISSSDSFQERLASALILNDHINSFLKEAAKVEVEVETKGKEDDEEDEEEDEEAEKAASLKAAHFIVQADEAGYSPEEIRSFIEKNASRGGQILKGLKGLISSKPVQVGGGVAGLTGAGYVGKEYGETKTEEKARKLVPKIYQAGLVRGHRKGSQSGFEAGAHAANVAWMQRLKRHSNKRAN
jgi:hypothetical protein